MTKKEFQGLLTMLADAWGRRDYTAVIGAFAEDVRYADPIRYSFNNRAQLQTFFEANEGYPQSTVWHTILFDEA